MRNQKNNRVKLYPTEILQDNITNPMLGNDDRYHSFLNILKGVEEYILSPTGTIISSNLEAVNITGYEEWEVIGRDFSIFYTSEDQIESLPERHLRKASEKGVLYVSGIRMKKRNSPFYAKMRIEPFCNSLKQVNGYRVTLKDATHKAIYGLNLRQIRDEYLNIFNNPFVGIFRFSMDDYKLKMLNEKGESLIGKDWHKLSFNEIFNKPSEFQQFLHMLHESAGKRVKEFEFEMRHDDVSNKPRYAAISCKAFPQRRYVEGIIVDVTERKLQMEKTLTLKSELENFIYHASHDLRSPITSMLGLINLLQKEGGHAVNEYADHLKEKVLHLDHVLKNLVFIAFNTTSPVREDKIDVKTEIITTLQGFGKNDDVSVTLDIGNVVLYSDSSRFSAIVRHLVTNAHQHGNQLEQKSIHIKGKETDGKFTLIITDNGIGIHADEIAKVFRGFYRGHITSKGTGLGLYLVKSAVDKLNGTIDISSKYGQGTTVTVVLPNNYPSHESIIDVKPIDVSL